MIEERADAVGFAAVKRAADALSAAYREGKPAALAQIPPAGRVAAYLVTRMPATYAAAHRALLAVRTLPIATILDLGAGAGAASLAAREFFPNASITMIERDAAFCEAARPWLPDAAIRTADIEQVFSLGQHDLVIAAYSLGELASEPWERFWSAARVAFVAIEPGTTRGYRLLMRMRERLLGSGAHMLAPCPMESACPLTDPDWCHFAARVERSSLHRRMKEGGLGYEDEKFSYLALSREPLELSRARIIRRPCHEPGLITLETCTPGGVETVPVRKRDRDLYRIARQVQWGDDWA